MQSLWAKIIERHITLDHNMWGTDQKSSLEIEGMTLLEKRVKKVNIYLGNNKKKITSSEKIAIKKLKNSSVKILIVGFVSCLWY